MRLLFVPKQAHYIQPTGKTSFLKIDADIVILFAKIKTRGLVCPRLLPYAHNFRCLFFDSFRTKARSNLNRKSTKTRFNFEPFWRACILTFDLSMSRPFTRLVVPIRLFLSAITLSTAHRQPLLFTREVIHFSQRGITYLLFYIYFMTCRSSFK